MTGWSFQCISGHVDYSAFAPGHSFKLFLGAYVTVISVELLPGTFSTGVDYQLVESFGGKSSVGYQLFDRGRCARELRLSGKDSVCPDRFVSDHSTPGLFDVQLPIVFAPRLVVIAVAFVRG